MPLSKAEAGEDAVQVLRIENAVFRIVEIRRPPHQADLTVRDLDSGDIADRE